jgi:type VI secretion system protein ImpJ
MKTLSPVVWSEGMHLGPHQFQAQSRYFEDSIEFATSALWFENWGLIGGELSPEALANGQAVLLHARGIFPDGLAFDIPESDPAPPAFDITEAFPPTKNRVTVFLAVPMEKTDGRNYAINGDAEGVRYAGEQRVVSDETTGRDERAIRFGRKAIRLCLEAEDSPETVKLPIARLMRSGSGKIGLDPTFIPPCLDVTASSRLLNLLGRLIQILEDRSRSLSLSRGEHAGMSLQEITRFWFLHAINSGLVPLKHLYQSRRGHPEHLYMELSRLAGALCTFSLDSHPRSLPAYDHRNLDVCFDALDLHVRRHLEIVLPTSCIRIPLSNTAEFFYTGDITDQRCFGAATWILAVRASGGEVDTMNRVPGLVKICSEAFVPELVKRALPGFALTHSPTPPASVSVRADTQYFRVNKAGPCWDHIKKTKRVGVYVPGDIPAPEIELLIAIDS